MNELDQYTQPQRDLLVTVFTTEELINELKSRGRILFTIYRETEIVVVKI